jgi:hypothetical protein
MGQPVQGDSADAKIPGVKGNCEVQGGAGVEGFGLSIGVLGHGVPIPGFIAVKGDGGGIPGPGGFGIPTFGVIGTTASATGIGVQGVNQSGGLAGDFEGNVRVAGTVSVTGGIGVGTVSPDRPLTVQAQRVGQELISFKDPSGATKWHVNQNLGGSNPGLNFVETGVADGRLFLQAGGKVGIGTTNPTAQLTVDGSVKVTGDVSVDGDLLLANRDLAEQFEVNSTAHYQPGMLMVLGENGALEPCRAAYDKRAIGVISGAGTLRPAITLGSAKSESPTAPIALVGTAFCLVDADLGAVEPGDLLTSSSTLGHAMNAKDSAKGFGAIVGKALASLREGRGLVPILITRQ